MDINQNQCPNKNDLMLAIKNQPELDNRTIGDEELNLDTLEDTSANSTGIKIQEKSNWTTISSPQKYLDTKSQFRKTAIIIKYYTSQFD